MAKPSIFSKEYKRRMKVRRRRVGIVTISIIVILGIVAFGGFASGWFKDGINFVRINRNDGKALLKGNKDENSEPAKSVDTSEKSVAVPTPTPTPVPVEKYHQVMLYEGKTIKVIYEDGTEGKKLKGIKDEVELYNNISPSGKSLVVWEPTTQNMFLIDSEGGVKNITKPSYVTKNSNTTYTKESQLKRKPQYIWCSSPKFIGEEAVAYVSNLPMLNETGQYIWLYETGKNDHRQIYTRGASNIVFKDFVDGKLNGEADGVAFSISADGKVENIK